MKRVLSLLLGPAASGVPNSPLSTGRLSSATLWANALTAIVLAVLTSTPVISADPTAAQILEKVSETYQGLKSFSFVVEQNPGIHSEMPDLETRVVESRPGKVRLTNELYTLVSNGAITWVYMRNRFGDEYTEVNAAPLLEETWRVSPLGFLGWEYLRSYTRVPARGAKLEGEKVLRVNGKRIQCYVVRVPVWGSIGPLQLVDGAEDLWVSNSAFMVWRTVAAGTWSAAPWGCGPRYVTLTLKLMDIGPVPEDDFRFAPPPGARRVSQLAPNEGLYLGHGGGTCDAPNASGGSVIGQSAPDFTLRGLDGKGFRLKDPGGTTLVLDFWASWCKPCQEELAAIEKLHDEFASMGVVFLGIDDESPETVKSFVKARGYSFPILVDSEQAVHELYGVRWAPTTVVIDRKGKIAAHYVGAGGEAQLRKALKSAGLNATP